MSECRYCDGEFATISKKVILEDKVGRKGRFHERMDGFLYFCHKKYSEVVYAPSDPSKEDL